MRFAQHVSSARLILGGSIALLSCRLDAQGTSADRRPTVAVMDFDNAALVRHADYESLGKGIAGMLNTELSANPGIRVVERESVHELLEEQKLGSSSRVSPETALRLGRLLGVHHMIFGAFVVDFRGRMRLDVRAVNVETSQLEYVASKTDAADEMLTLVADVARMMNDGMKLPPLPPPAARRTSAAAPAEGARSRAVRLYSRALEERDRGNVRQATAFCREALSLLPDFVAARQALDRLEQPAASTPTKS